MTVGRKISLACTTLVVLTIAMGASALWSLVGVSNVAQRIVADPLPGNYLGGRMNAGVKKMMVWMCLHILSDSEAERSKLESKIAQREKQWRGEWERYRPLVGDDRDRAAWQGTGAAFDRIMRTWDRIGPLSRAGQSKEASAAFHDEAGPALEELDRQVNILVNDNNAQGEALAKEAKSSAALGRAQIWIVLAVSVLSGAALAFLIVRGINRKLRQIADELGRGAAQVASAAGEVASGSQILAQSSSEQAAALEETSASSEEINSMARKSTENSRAAADLIASSQRKFDEANRALENMVGAMREIGASSEKISKIIRVIDEIAFQTNILALNAAVEAARAGESGMGFAVVADEVRNLAQRSAQAARDTASLIEESIARSKGGQATVDEVAVAVRSITEQSAQVKVFVDEVNVGSQEQSRGIEQVAKAISQMDSVTQKNAATAEESASAAEELTAQSEALKQIVANLNEMVLGT